MRLLYENLQTSIKVSVGLFTAEIYANFVRKEEGERWPKILYKVLVVYNQNVAGLQY